MNKNEDFQVRYGFDEKAQPTTGSSRVKLAETFTGQKTIFKMTDFPDSHFHFEVQADENSGEYQVLKFSLWM